MLTYQNWLTHADILVNYLKPTANFLLVLYSSVNTLFYGICSTSFREKFKDIILCGFCKHKKYLDSKPIASGTSYIRPFSLVPKTNSPTLCRKQHLPENGF